MCSDFENKSEDNKLFIQSKVAYKATVFYCCYIMYIKIDYNFN